MARHFRFQRRSPSRASKPMILVATEGKETEPVYFELLKTVYRHVVTVLVSPGRSGQSNPRRVLKRLQDSISKQASWTARDQAWLVVDTDQWTGKERQETERKIAADPRLHLASSNPCFELWLLLHFRDGWAAATGQDLAALLNSRECLGTFCKETYDAAALLPRIEAACGRAKHADRSSANQWTSPGETHVYRVVERIIQPQHFP